MKRIISKIFSTTLSLFIMLAVISIVPSPRLCANTTPWSGSCVDTNNPDVATIQGVECLVRNILNIAVTAVGIAAFVMFLVGSFLYLTSGGNPRHRGWAKRLLLPSLVWLFRSPALSH